MFFEISRRENKNFPKNFYLKKNLFLNVDSGWRTFAINNKQIYFKGYVTEARDEEKILIDIINDPTPKFKGNFFCVICDDEKIVLTHDKTRGTPLYYFKDEEVFTNLTIGPIIGANILCELNYNFDVNFKKHKPYVVNDEKISYDKALNKIYNIIAEDFEIFLTKNKFPIKIFLSGGIDTLTMYSFLKKFTSNFELVDYEYKKFSHFYKNNWKQRIKKFWGYNQMHTWGEEPAALISGACGDAFMMRGPDTLKLFCDYHNIDLTRLLAMNKDCYQYNYFCNNEGNKKIFKEGKKIFYNEKYLISYILNIIINDHQHWHIDDTIFFTPFKNIELPNIILNIDKEIVIEQALDARITKDLIIKNNPADLKLLNKSKIHSFAI